MLLLLDSSSCLLFCSARSSPALVHPQHALIQSIVRACNAHGIEFYSVPPHIESCHPAHSAAPCFTPSRLDLLHPTDRPSERRRPRPAIRSRIPDLVTVFRVHGLLLVRPQHFTVNFPRVAVGRDLVAVVAGGRVARALGGARVLVADLWVDD
jgi:hypothetical protein